MISEIYNYLPIGLQNFLISYEGKKRIQARFGEDFEKIYQEYMGRSFWTQDQTREFRDRRLSDFLALVFKCSPEEALAKFKQHPVMTRRDAFQYFQKESLSLYPAQKARTSGTTGESLHFYTTVKAEREQWSVWWRHRTWHGIPRDEWSGYFGSHRIVPLHQQKPPFWRENRAGKQLIFSNYHIDKENIPYYLKELKESGLRWIHGYPSSISLLASHACDLGIQVPMKWVTTSSENLLSFQAEAIERAFGVKPIQHYGLAEEVANISECPQGKFHVDEDFSYVEFIPTGFGENVYRITGTNFTNPVFPLIRYDTEDLAIVHPEDTCDCGRPGRIVRSLDGRQEDFVVTKKGKWIGLMEPIFKTSVNIPKAQIRQDRPGYMDILVVRGAAYDLPDEKKLKDQTRLILGDDMDFEIQYVDDIPKTKTGKHRLVVSTLKKE
jgi:phenylacetate-CoA ligase